MREEERKEEEDRAKEELGQVMRKEQQEVGM